MSNSILQREKYITVLLLLLVLRHYACSLDPSFSFLITNEYVHLSNCWRLSIVLCAYKSASFGHHRAATTAAKASMTLVIDAPIATPAPGNATGVELGFPAEGPAVPA